MKIERNIIDEAVENLRKHTGISILIEDGKYKHSCFLSIANEKFVIQIKNDISKGNKGMVMLQSAESSKESGFPVVVITKYIPTEIAAEYRMKGVNYLDVAGNCTIKQNNLFIQLEGKKKEKINKTNQSRAFQEAGIRIIFQLLSNPENINMTYRDLAEISGVSLGSVGSVLQELIDLHFILKTKNKKILKNRTELLERWMIAYHDVLSPRLLLKRMRFVDKKSLFDWQHIDFGNSNNTILWGGEPAASILTKSCTPSRFTIYTDESWQSLSNKGMAPAEDGEIELFKIFWMNKNDSTIVSPLLIYADLMSSGSDKNIELAKTILESELKHIK